MRLNLALEHECTVLIVSHAFYTGTCVILVLYMCYTCVTLVLHLCYTCVIHVLYLCYTCVIQARLRMSNIVDKDDINEAMRLMEMSKDSLNAEERQQK